DLARDAVEVPTDIAPDAAEVPLELAAVPPHGALHPVPALAQLALDLGPRALDATLDPVVGGVAAALELPQVRADPALKPLDLAARGIRLHERPDRLDDVVARDQRRPDRNQDDPLRLLSDGLETGGLGLR